MTWWVMLSLFIQFNFRRPLTLVLDAFDIVTCIMFLPWIEPAEDLVNSAALSDDDVANQCNVPKPFCRWN